ncbi:hypothetical protein C8R44DRAFT_869072 [Mycena epipterygia]|nr:hypothetical protein C8R44DRAFT_869072 [Mycena epipterygia]
MAGAGLCKPEGVWDVGTVVEFDLHSRYIYAVNVLGTEAVTTAIRPLLANGGAINISSTLSSIAWYTKTPPVHPFFAQYIAYSTSKSALNALTVH